MTPQNVPLANAKRVMVTDDESDLLLLLEVMLRDAGYVVDTAHDGKECLQKIQQNLPDVLILDIMMPGVNGIDVARYLKAIPYTSTIPIIFLTGLTDRQLMKTALMELGVEFYLTKPFESEDLLEKVKQVIRHKVDPHIRG